MTTPTLLAFPGAALRNRRTDPQITNALRSLWSVVRRNQTDLETLDADALPSVLLAAIHEAHDRIDELEARVAALEAP